jgi:aminomethyltransferase
MKQTPLFKCHQNAQARFVDFGGWEMPVQYTGIQAEHEAVRQDLGIFDVSHMGEVDVSGPGALDAVNYIITNDLTQIADTQALYTAMCLPTGGIIDDLVVYRFNPQRIFICVNASNREKDVAWITEQIKAFDPQVQVNDVSDQYAQIAIQGPRTQEFLSTYTETPLSDIGRYWFKEGQIAGVSCIISRTGYTGEDGFELYLPADQASQVWDAFMTHDHPPLPCGLGARDTLRLEMKYALYGNDINEDTTPLEAGLRWLTKLKKEHFIGKDALVKQNEAGLTRFLVAFKLDGRAIARHGYPVINDEGEQIGEVTSGTRSPTLGEPIGMAYVPYNQRKAGSKIRVQIRKKSAEGVVIKPPFISKA